jgi:hypothetical protein
LSLPGPAAQHGCRRAVVVRAQVVVAAAAVEQRRAADLAAEVQRVAAVLTVDGDVAHAVVVDVDLVVAVARVHDQRERAFGASGHQALWASSCWQPGPAASAAPLSMTFRLIVSGAAFVPARTSSASPGAAVNENGSGGDDAGERTDRGASHADAT